MYININITFMHISISVLVSKSTSFTFFHMNIHTHHHIFHRRFVYIHTFFHCKMMCGCRLAICLYNISHADYERRLHHVHVAPSVPIWAEFISILGKICRSRFEPPQASKAAIFVCAARPYYIYAHICRGKWWCCNPHTRTWENPGRFFARRAIICTVYCWEKCKKL